MSATSQITGHLNFPLHSVTNTETLTGPNYRVTVRRDTGVGRVILSRWPVTNIVSVQVSPQGVYPYQWTTVPAGFYQPEYPVIARYSSNTPSASGEGGQAVLIAPPYVNWCNGRWGWNVQVTYNHGWPHTALSAAATAGATSVQVYDCTGWAPFTAGAPGAAGVVYDNLGGQEGISVTAATATAGPGALTLSGPLTYAHDPGIMVSALPADVIWAGALFAGAAALTRGAQATAVQVTPGHGVGMTGADSLAMQAKAILKPFERTI